MLDNRLEKYSHKVPSMQGPDDAAGCACVTEPHTINQKCVPEERKLVLVCVQPLIAGVETPKSRRSGEAPYSISIGTPENESISSLKSTSLFSRPSVLKLSLSLVAKALLMC